MNTLSVVFVTYPQDKDPNNFAQSIISSNLAACVNILPAIQSVYKWNGKIETENECLFILKVPSAQIDQLKQFVLANHPYSTPEFVAIECDKVSEGYLNWALNCANEAPVKA